MSPQPDVTALDVQKYIGPCLISQKPRVRKSNRVKEKYGSNNNDNNLVMANNNNNNNSSVHRMNDYRKLRGGSRHAISSPPLTPAYAICECCGSFKFALGTGCPPQPPPPMHHQHHLNLPLTGFPLINMTNVAKKQGASKTSNRNVPIYSHSNRMPSSIGENDVDGSSNLYNWDDGGQQRGQLSRLAVHTEGVPLILSQRFNSNYRKYKNFYPPSVYRMPTGKYTNNPSPYSSPTSSSTMVNCPDFLRDFNEGLDLTDGCYGLPQVADDLQENNGCGSTPLLIQRADPARRQNSPFNSDCMSVTSEESSSLSECNFPRRNVVKLKRRRKRGVNGGSEQTSEDVGSSSSSSSSPPPPRSTRSPPTENLRSLVTLRPYMPLCYHFGENEMFNDWNDDEEEDENEEEEEEEDEDEEEGEISGEEEEEENFNKRSERFLSSFALESVGGGGGVGSVWNSKYPYPPSPLCQCATCAPTILATPPDSPYITSPSSSSDSGSLSDSISPFPSPPSSPSLTRGTPPTNAVRYGGGCYDGSELWMTSSSPLSNYNVATRIVSSYNNTGSKDLEIKFLYDNNNQVYRHYYQQQQSQSLLHHHHHLNDVISGGDNGVSFSLFDGLDDCSLSPSPDDVSYPESNSASLFKRPSVVTSSQPPSRPWITLAQPSRTHPVCTFTVMCYNVLCDKYATRQMYGYCPNWALNWDYRRKGIMDEIRHYMADVISLQEVETEQFYNMFLPELKKDGYDGIFSPKSRAKTMSENDRKYVDGCAIFYKTNKFRLIKEYLVEFTQLAIAIAEGSDNMLNRVMIRDNIGLVALLETKEGAWENGLPPDMASVHQPLLVCTAHIHWDPEYCDVKLIQTMMLMSELQNIVEESARSFRPGSKKCDPSLMPLLLCGDFNSLPNSGVIDFLTAGRISVTHPDFKELAYESCLKKLSSTDKPSEYTHCFKIAKAYSNNIMPFTNFTFDFKGIIDYILHSDQSLVPLGLLGPLDAQWMKENKVVGCPHPHIPSDHFPLVVAFEMTPPQISLTNGMVLRR